MNQKIYIAGMASPDDEKKVHKAVSALSGVSNCVVNWEKAQAAFTFDENTTSLDKIKEAISSCGFDVLG